MTEDQMPNFKVPETAKRTQEEHLQEIVKDMAGGWIPAKLYCAVFDENMARIKHRLKKGSWQRGVHYAVPDGGGAWVNVPAVRRWIESQTKAPEGASGEDLSGS